MVGMGNRVEMDLTCSESIIASVNGLKVQSQSIKFCLQFCVNFSHSSSTLVSLDKERQRSKSRFI